MSTDISAKPNQPIHTESVTQEPNDRKSKMDQFVKSSEDFNKATSKRVEIAPNIELVLLFDREWYLDWDSLYSEYRTAYHKTEEEAIRLADENYKVRKVLRESTEKKGDQYATTTYLVTLPNSQFPDMVKEFSLSSPKAIETLNEKLYEVSQKYDGKIIVSFMKKQGSTNYDVEWKVKAEPWEKS